MQGFSCFMTQAVRTVRTEFPYKQLVFGGFAELYGKTVLTVLTESLNLWEMALQAGYGVRTVWTNRPYINREKANQ